MIETKGSPETYDARAVANFILDLAERDGRALTQVALLKILYFAHGWVGSSFIRTAADHAPRSELQPCRVIVRKGVESGR